MAKFNYPYFARRYDYINRQLYSGIGPNAGLMYLQQNMPDLWLSADSGLKSVGARSLDGVDQSFTMSNVPNYSTDNISIEGWFNHETSTIDYILGTGGINSTTAGISIYCSTSISIACGNGVSNSVASFTLTQATLNWNHFVFTIDRTNNQVSCYLNTTLIGESTGISGINGSFSPINTYKSFGNLRNAGTGSFLGAISRLRIAVGYVYQTSDINDSFNLGNGKFFGELSSDLQSKITHNYNLNEVTGQALDCVSSNHASISGTSTTIGSTDGPRESQVSDNSSNSYHLTLVNYSQTQKLTSWVASTFGDGGYALQFIRASSHYVTSGSSKHAFAATTDGFNKGTIIARVYSEATTTVSHCGICSFFDWEVGFTVIGVGKQLYGYLQDASGATTDNAASFSSSGSILPNTWYEVAYRFDAGSTDRYIHLFINGVKNTTNYTSLKSTAVKYLGNLEFRVGVALDSTNGFQGKIDFVKVYNSALPTSDILAHYVNGGTTHIPVMDYTFNDGPQVNALSNGDVVAGWESKDNNRYQFLQETLIYRPSLISNAIGGQNAIGFDGLGDYFKLNRCPLSGNNGVTFIVVKRDSTSFKYLLAAGNQTTGIYRIGLGHSASGQPYIYYQNGSTNVDVFTTSTGAMSTNYSLVTFGSNGTNYFVNVNSKSYALSGVSNGKWFGQYNATDLVNLTISGMQTTSILYTGKSNFAEIIAYDGSNTPSTNNIKNIESYLLSKYGIST